MENAKTGHMGARIYVARQARGLSREQLAHAIGVTSNSIYRYEKEGMDMKGTIAVKMAEELGITLDWLLLGESMPDLNPVLQTFLDHDEFGSTASYVEQQILSSIHFPEPFEPTVSLYHKLLHDIRSELRTGGSYTALKAAPKRAE